METITSLQNAKVKKWCSLHQKKNRDETGLFLIEGEHLINEALKADCLIHIITDLDKKLDFPSVYQVTPAIMKKLSQNVSAVHLIGVCRKKSEEPQNASRILLLDDIQDPGNLGTLIRTAVSFSFDAVYCSKDTCDIYNDKAIRSTQGALFHIPVIYTQLDQLIVKLKKKEFAVIATALDSSVPLASIQAKAKMAFILGNEGQGVSKPLQQDADQCLRIEMDGFESLNVAVAGGIIMYQFQKRRAK